MSRTTTSRQTVTAKNYDDLCVRAVEKIISLASRAIAERGRCRLALSGGTTPKGVYALLAAPEYREQLDWSSIQIFMVDERWVPADDARSNFKMILDSGIPSAQIHPIKTDVSDPGASAWLYQQELFEEFQLQKGLWPQFDLILLGMGEDGHTASLFPGHPVLKEEDHLVSAVEFAGVPEKRVTLTLPVLNHARSVLFLVSGRKKALVLKEVLEGRAKNLPAGQVHGPDVCWFVDQAASAKTS